MELFSELAEEQRQLGEDISRALSNMRKDSIVRKDKTYIERRLAEFDSSWKKFQENHNHLEKLDRPSEQYFTQNFYIQVKSKYDEAKELLREYQQKLNEQPVETAANTTGTKFNIKLNDDLEEKTLRLKKQSVKMSNIRRILDEVAERGQAKTKTYCEFKIKQLTTQWDAIQELHEEILTFAEEGELSHQYFKEEQYETLEEIYQETMIELQDMIEENSQREDAVKTKLPQIKIPNFDGDYKTWKYFENIFCRLIHNNKRLGNAEKMHYLQTSLAGEAHKLIQHLASSESSYEAAWSLVTSRFNNKRKIFSTFSDAILDQPALITDSAKAIKQLHDLIKECLHGINSLQLETPPWEPFIAHIIRRKMDPETYKAYEQSLNEPREIPQLEDILKFLETRFQALEVIAEPRKKTESSRIVNHVQSRGNHQIKSYHTSTTKCRYCNGQHSIYVCQKFKALKLADKLNFVRQSKTCSNCLNHGTNDPCHSQSRCNICKQQHHTLIHQEARNPTAKQEDVPRVMSSHLTTSQCTVDSHVVRKSCNVILATALVRAKTIRNSYEYLRVLVDPGSQATLITENAAQTLGVPRVKIYSEITGTNECPAGTSHSKILVELIPRFPSNFKLQCEALILPSVTSDQPQKYIVSEERTNWSNLILADPTYDTPGPVDMILGADVFGDILMNSIRKTKGGTLTQKTEFGWILSGPIPQSEATRKITSMISRVDVDSQLRKFWEIEETALRSPVSEENRTCEEQFDRTVKRNPNGTYTVQIPFKQTEGLGESKPVAIARLYQMEKRFSKNKTLRDEYNKFMEEYLQLGHMVLIDSKELQNKTPNVYYMPHQAVIKEESTTTKLRVVFDASTKTSTKLSLNDLMHSGPRLQQDLQDILLRWRKHQYVFSADIEKMYRQIKVAQEHQDYQRIVWRFSTEDSIQEFKLTTVTYGTKSAPYLAIKTLQKLARDEEKNHPEAAKIILNDFYVDDMMSGASSIQEARRLQGELIQTLKEGGFNLRKWRSNHSELIDNLPKQLRDQGSIEIKDDEAVKSLGIYWTPIADKFHFKVKLNAPSEVPTKRTILSEIARLFDPLGWLAPITVRAKMLIQELWAKGYNWDQTLEEELATRWMNIRNELRKLEEINIPRWIQYTPACKTVELHGFCDASEKAYGAVVYSKTTLDSEQVHITLLVAKTKVAPLNKVTLPRLELCGAVLLSKLIRRTKQALDIKNVREYAWTDSMITLAWIHGKSNKWETFIANRVSEVHKNLEPTSWRHVRSEDNPADLVSRGATPQYLKNAELWWTGPSWLKMTEDKWPTQKINKNITTGAKLDKIAVHATQIAEGFELLSRFSSFKKLTRVLAYCKRFIAKCRKDRTNNTNLSVKELDKAHQQLLQMTQKTEFAAEIKQLEAKKPLNTKSSILSLNPFLDENGILRVGGRIQNSRIPYNQKHPVIIPHKHHITKLLILEAHAATLHGGNEVTHAYIRRRYFIINGKSKIRQILNKCVTCCRHKGQTVTQIMGELPAARVTPAKPFSHTGLDYAGPIQIRMSKGRGSKSHKGYIAVFVCLVTKAIHIEAVTDMTTEAFLAAFRRFTSRRGLVSNIYSDNGTTFVGAQKVLDKDLRHAIRNITTVVGSLATEGIQWHFIPPAAPHFGGIWEAGVKSIKSHLKKVIGNATLTFEEMSTLLCQIEACLNSRPLYPLPSDPSSILTITPGHFLVGQELIGPPGPTIDSTMTTLSRWKLVQKMTQDFWKVWQSEYLSRLQQRTKWKSGARLIEAGQIVLVKDENCAPTRWPLARIIETHPGKDGVVRVVTLRVKENSTIKRPVTKICVLPVEDDNMTNIDDTTPTEIKKCAMAHVTETSAPQTGIESRLHTDKKTTHKSTNTWSMGKMVLATLAILSSIQPGHTHYTIKYPQPGLFIEQIGHAKLKRDNQNYFFGQSGQGRFVPSFQSTRSNFFSPSTGSFQSFRNAQHNGSPGSYQEQTLFIGEEATTPQDTSSPFVPFPPYQSTRSPDYYELSPRPFGAGAASSSSFSRPQSVRPNGGSGFVPQKSAGRSNVPHQQSQFLAHFNEQTHLPGVPTEKTTTQSSRVGRPFGSGFSRNRPVGSSLNRQPTEDLYPSQQQLPFRNSRNRFQPSAERTTSTTTTSTSTSSPEKTSRYNRFGSGRSVQTSKAPTVQSVSSTTTSTRSKLNKNIFQPRRPVFISREVNEPVHLKSRVFPSKITINHNGSNNDAEEDEEALQEEINETDHVQEKPVTENVKDIPVEEFEKLGLHEPVQNATIQNALNASGNGDGQPVIITSNFFLPQDNAEQQEEQQEEQPQQEQQQQETQKEEQKQEHEQQQQDEESEGERTSEEELSTTQRPDYEYEYEDYEEKSTTLPTPAEEIATVKEVHPDQETTATEEDKKETNSDGNNEEITNFSETAPEGTTAEQSGSEEGSAEYEDDELLDDEEDEEGEFEEGSEEASPEEVQEQPKQDQNNPEDIVGKAVVQVITTKSVVNGSTAVPQSISSTTSSGDTVYKENNKPPALEPNKNVEGSPAEDEGVNNATESYVVVASIQTSRSISGARFLPFPVVEQEEKKQTLSELERKIHEQKSIVRPTKKSSVSDTESESTENILPKEQPQETTTEISIITTTDAIPETTTEKSVTNQSISTESIIDKLDRVQSELSSGLLSGKFPILNEMPELEIPTTTTTTTTSAPRFVPNFRKYGKTTTSRPEKSRIDIESIPMDDLSGLLPPGFKPRQNSYRNRKITTTTTKSTTTTTTTTTAAPKVNAENTVHKPSRNYTIGRSFKNTPLTSQDVTLAGLLPKGFKANTSVTEAPATQKNLKDLLSKIKFEDNLDKLLPKDYREKAPKTTTAKPSVTVVDDISKFLPPGFKPLSLNSTEKSFPVIPIKNHNAHLPHPGLKGPSTTTKKPPISVVPISDDLSKFLPPGFKLDPSKNDDSGPIDISKLLPKDFKAGGEEKPEDIIIKKIELKDVSSLLPSGYKENLTKEEEPASSTEKTDSGLKIVFPKGINKRPGVRLTTPKSSGADGPAPPAIVIKKGPPTRATTEFTGWPTPSTTPFSIEKLLEEQKAAPIDISELLSSSTTTTTTTTTTTMEPPKPTEPGHCRSECDLAGTIKIVDGVKWKPELLDHNTDEWKNLAREVEAQLNEVYSNAPHLSKWYKKVRIDSFNKGSVLVDYFVELSNISRNVDTLEIKRLFHEALVTAPLPVVPLHETNETRDSSEREEKLVKETLLLGRFVVDPVSTDFIVIPKPLSPTVEFAEEDVLIPQWAIVVIVIGVGSLCFVVIFGVTVLVNRQRRAKKTPTPLTNDMLHELNKNHMGGIENYGVDEFYNVDDTWGDTKQPIKPKRFTNSMHGSSASNIYDSWRSQRGGDYYYDNHNYTPHKIDPYPPDAFADAHQMYTYNPRTRYHRDYDPDF